MSASAQGNLAHGRPRLAFSSRASYCQQGDSRFFAWTTAARSSAACAGMALPSVASTGTPMACGAASAPLHVVMADSVPLCLGRQRVWDSNGFKTATAVMNRWDGIVFRRGSRIALRSDPPAAVRSDSVTPAMTAAAMIAQGNGLRRHPDDRLPSPVSDQSWFSLLIRMIGG